MEIDRDSMLLGTSLVNGSLNNSETRVTNNWLSIGKLTLDTKLQVIADRLALTIDGAARVIAARVACHLLQDQALVGTDHSGARVVR